MRRFEVRITVASTSRGAVVDRESIEALLRTLAGHALSLRGTNGRRLHVAELRHDPTPSSAAAIIAVVEDQEEP